MDYVGIDLHKKKFSYYASDKDGEEISSGSSWCNIKSVDCLLESFSSAPKIVVEATRNWEWFIDRLMEKDCHVVMAHPFKTKAIAFSRIKTDSIDAKTLCDLLRADIVPTSYIPTKIERDSREISRCRINLVHDRTYTKNRIISLLAKENLCFSGSDLFTQKGKEWISKQNISGAKREIINLYLARLEDLGKAIEEIEMVIKQKSSDLPQVKLLESIPGIGTITAFLLASEIGDINRFNSSRSFASYFGLVPRLNQSGDHAYYGRITKLGNPFVRWSLVQTVYRMERMDQQTKKFIFRLTLKSGRKKAVVAAARKLSTIIYCILKEKREYIPNYQRALMSRPDILPESPA